MIYKALDVFLQSVAKYAFFCHFLFVRSFASAKNLRFKFRFLARANERTNEGVPRGSRGPKKRKKLHRQKCETKSGTKTHILQQIAICAKTAYFHCAIN